MLPFSFLFFSFLLFPSLAHHEVGRLNPEGRERHVQGLGEPQEAAAYRGAGGKREKPKMGGGGGGLISFMPRVESFEH